MQSLGEPPAEREARRRMSQRLLEPAVEVDAAATVDGSQAHGSPLTIRFTPIATDPCPVTSTVDVTAYDDARTRLLLIGACRETLVAMARDVDGVIRRTSLVTGVVAAVLSPIPLLDEIVLVPIYTVLTTRIAARHELPLRRVPWRPIAKTGLAGLIARGIVNLGVALVPGVSAVANAATAMAFTEVLGRYIDDACGDPQRATPLAVKDIVTLLRAHPRTKAGRAPAAAVVN